MTNILVVYASDYGNTRKMAEAIARGAGRVPDTTVSVKAAEEVQERDFVSADGILFGSPVHMGSPDWRVKALIDKVCSGLWMKDALVGKVGGVFVTGSGYGHGGSGAELTLLALLSNLAELGMIIVPLPKNTPGYPQGGIHWGAYGRSAGENLEPIGLRDAQLVAAEHHGANVARVAAALKGKKLLGV